MDASKRRAVSRNSESPVVDKSMYVSAVDSIDKLSFKEESVFGDTASNNIIVDHEDIYMDDLSNGPGGECGPQWVWLTVGSCRIDPVGRKGVGGGRGGGVGVCAGRRGRQYDQKRDSTT